MDQKGKMSGKILLKVDAVINFILGILLLLAIPFPKQITEFLGVPGIAHSFYASILGAVFIGIGIGLVIESRRVRSDQIVGLGLGGAAAINLCGGGLLIGWLLFGDLNLPVRGQVFLWWLAFILVLISGVELIAYLRKQDN